MATSKQRRQAELRRLKRQSERRARRQRARRRNNVIFSVLGILVVVGVVIGLIVATNGDDSKPAAQTTPPGPSSTAVTSPSAPASTSRTPTYPCTWTTASAATRKVSVPPSTKPPRTGKVGITVKTTRGPLTLSLDRSLAPCTVASFVSLVKQGYYDRSPCHRLTTANIFVLQCGSPDGSPGGEPGYTIPDEATGQENYPAGTIAMARSQDPHSGGGQFFIVYKDSPNLKQGLGQLQYTVFGKVASGLSVVTGVAKGKPVSGTDGKPKLGITLRKMELAK